PWAPDEPGNEDVVARGPALPAIRVSNAERQDAIAVLQRAVVEGRLTLEEYSDRVGVAVGARTDQELGALTNDLPRSPARYDASRSGTAVEHRALFSHIVRR